MALSLLHCNIDKDVYLLSMTIQRLLIFSAWLALAAIVLVTVSPIGLRPYDLLPVNVDRAIAFAVTSTLFVTAFPRHWKLSAILLITGAFGIELLQLLSSTRHAQFNDAQVKAAGAVLGILAGCIINQLRARRQP